MLASALPAPFELLVGTSQAPFIVALKVRTSAEAWAARPSVRAEARRTVRSMGTSLGSHLPARNPIAERRWPSFHRSAAGACQAEADTGATTGAFLINCSAFAIGRIEE